VELAHPFCSSLQPNGGRGCNLLKSARLALVSPSLRIPFIGWAMRFANHIAISRADRASQLKTLKEAVKTLNHGNSLVIFPEGTRSKNGRLAEFKKGPFTMASRANVRVVPVSIVGTQLYQPPGTVFPFMRPRGVRIICHPPLEAPKAKKEQESLDAARKAVLSGLPLSMRPLEEI
jgi:1-acyl-sn-glycerol-3-phosphate acyltransferase